ncbi:MAG TPA: Ig-like domain-containing protein [Vicinamibacteria bacterium]|nr:Ig-like domain-containing protein [Vicinamibacteria bacterium]
MRIPSPSTRGPRPGLCIKAAALLFLVTGCGLDKPATPNLSGPSDSTPSVDLAALPDVVNADGVSQSVIRLVLRDQLGSPIATRSVLFQFDGDGAIAPSKSSIFVGPVQTGLVMATDKDGVAAIVYVAGTSPGTVTFFVRPYGTDTSLTWERSVSLVQR